MNKLSAKTSVNDLASSKDLEQHEHNEMSPAAKNDPILSWHESIKQNPKAMLWCFYMLFTCIMWGYDGLAGSIVLAIPRFREDYGYLYEGEWVVPAQWQLAFTGASIVGLFIGGLVTGIVQQRYGQKICMAGGYILTVAGVCLQWLSPGNLPMFFGGKLLTGIPLGVFVTVTPTFCTEVAPRALRGAMVSAVNWSIVLGQLLGYGVMRQTQAIDGPNSYRTMFAVQWGFAAVAITGLPFCPESPMRLIARGKTEAAKKSIRKLYSSNFDVDAYINETQATLSHDAKQAANGGGYLECFNSKNRLRTLIALSVFFIQANSGVSWVVGYMGYFLQLAGMEGTKVFNTTVGIAGLMVIGCMAAWPLVELLGRRRTILCGLFVMTISLFLIGALSCFSGQSTLLAQVAFMAVWAFFYQASIGAVGYTLIAEVPTSSLRGSTQSLATMMNSAANVTWSFALPYIINPDQANFGGKVAFLFGGILVFCDVFAFFFYPETKGRTFAEIDELFARGVKPRHFAKTKLI